MLRKMTEQQSDNFKLAGSDMYYCVECDLYFRYTGPMIKPEPRFCPICGEPELRGWQMKLNRRDVCPCHGMTNCQLWEK